MKSLTKIILAGVLALFCACENMAGSFRDSRDGKTYKTVRMPDGNTWMAENLNHNMSGSMCYDNDASNCSKYGRLYTWEAAKKACPSGWYLPSRDEFSGLLNAVGDDKSKKLRARSSYGFSALPAGYYNGSSEKFDALGSGAHFWSSTEHFAYIAYNLFIDEDRAYYYSDFKTYGFSVRCVQGSN